MYISLHHNHDRSFKGNQSYTRQKGEVSVRDDDTTYIYKNMSRKSIKEFKTDYKQACRGNFKMVGSYPQYSIDYCN